MNSLGGEKSPYLRSAASGPVQWMPWGAAAFERARKENKPILLDIGAAWCHWCHVMDRESYEDERVARLINEKFVAIKADRDERPDIDARFQKQVSAISGQGGWPLTAFLTPEGKCFYGGTYFPSHDGFGRPGFVTVLRSVAAMYSTERDRVEQAAEELHRVISSAAAQAGTADVSAGRLDECLAGIMGLVDMANGGFGSRPKFHHGAAVELLMAACRPRGGDEYKNAALRALFGMAEGGIRDHLAGGFHRYSVDEGWRVPHFEKLACDNAELLTLYARAYALFGEPVFFGVAIETARFAREDLMDRERGGFYASQDADTGLNDDGDHFTWTLGEASQALAPLELEIMRRHFNIRNEGEMAHDPARLVLRIGSSSGEIARELGMAEEEVESLIAGAKKKMLLARRARPVPFVDKTMYANLNGMMISAFAAAGPLLGDFSMVEDAKRAFNLIAERDGWFGNGVSHARSEDGGTPGTLDDYARLSNAAVDLYEATGDERYLDASLTIASGIVERFRDGDGGYTDAEKGVDPVIGAIVNKPYQDTPTASPNSAAMMAMLRLYHHTGDEKWEKEAGAALAGAGDFPAADALFYASCLSVMSFYLGGYTEITVTGAGAGAEELARAALSVYAPVRVLKRLRPGSAGRAGGLSAAIENAEDVKAYVCRGGACLTPVSSPGKLRELLREGP